MRCTSLSADCRKTKRHRAAWLRCWQSTRMPQRRWTALTGLLTNRHLDKILREEHTENLLVDHIEVEALGDGHCFRHDLRCEVAVHRQQGHSLHANVLEQIQKVLQNEASAANKGTQAHLAGSADVGQHRERIVKAPLANLLVLAALYAPQRETYTTTTQKTHPCQCLCR